MPDLNRVPDMALFKICCDWSDHKWTVPSTPVHTWSQLMSPHMTQVAFSLSCPICKTRTCLPENTKPGRSDAQNHAWLQGKRRGKPFLYIGFFFPALFCQCTYITIMAMRQHPKTLRITRLQTDSSRNRMSKIKKKKKKKRKRTHQLCSWPFTMA